MIELSKVTKEYSIEGGQKVVALDNADLCLPDSGVVAIVGKSGSGKTTLLNLLGGLDKPTGGCVALDGVPLRFDDYRQLDLYRNYIVSFVFQDYNLLDDYSVADNIELGIKIQGVSKEDAGARIAESLRQVDLCGFEKRKIGTLSGGQKQRVSIARALCKDSKIVLCDEPTGNLDSKTSKEIFEVIKRLSAYRLFVVVTHDEESALRYADRIVTICDGQIVDDHTVDNQPQTACEGDGNAPSCYEVQERDAGTGTGDGRAEDSAMPECGERPHDDRAAKPLSIDKGADNGTTAQWLAAAGRAAKGSDKSNKKHNKAHGVGLLHCLQMVKHNITHFAFFSIVILLLLTVCFTLVSVFVSLSQYDKKTAFVNTLRANDQYMISATKYIDRLITYPSGNQSYGYAEANYLAKESDKQMLIDLLPATSRVYCSYQYSKPFTDYQGVESCAIAKTDYAYAFREVIVVDDFADIYLPLRYGTWPTQDDEIAIYDYMAASLIAQGVLEGDIASLVGKSLVDTAADITLRICGIVQSQYESMIALPDDDGGQYFATSYLAGLHSIFCKPNLLPKLRGQDFVSVMNSRVISNTATEGMHIRANKWKKIQPDTLDLFATNGDISQAKGIVLSSATVASLLHIPQEELTVDRAQAFMTEYRVTFDMLNNNAGLYPIGTLPRHIAIVAVCNQPIDQEGMLYYVGTEDLDGYNVANGVFRQFYVALRDDWDYNAAVVDSLWYPEPKPRSFYEANPDYYDETYAMYDPTGYAIGAADAYLSQVKRFADLIAYIVLGLSFAVLLVYTSMTVQRYYYKIGVLKALGAKTSTVVLIFGLQLLLIALIAFVLSIPFSAILMGVINSLFVETIGVELVFFALTVESVAIAFAFATVGVAVVAGIPLTKLAVTPPIKTINKGKKNR